MHLEGNFGDHDSVTPHTSLPPSVNFHLWKPCNERCKYCYATFHDDEMLRGVRGGVSEPDARAIISELASHGVSKLNFAGGEPTLCPWLPSLLQHAHSLNLTTSIVTNGKRLEWVLASAAPHLNWVGLSVDSANEHIQQALGRGGGQYVAETARLAGLVRARGIRLKLNTVVTSLNAGDDTSNLLLELRPERWKVFQFLPIQGQNDDHAAAMKISAEEFKAYVARHLHLKVHGITLVPEDNDAMTGSYAMIDPLGRFFSDVGGSHTYSRRILDVGVSHAFREIAFFRDRYFSRGGNYDWRGPSPTSLTVSAQKA